MSRAAPIVFGIVPRRGDSARGVGMTVTYTRAAERDVRASPAHDATQAFPMPCCARHHSSPPSAIALAYFGRMGAFDRPRRPGTSVRQSI